MTEYTRVPIEESVAMPGSGALPAPPSLPSSVTTICPSNRSMIARPCGVAAHRANPSRVAGEHFPISLPPQKTKTAAARIACMGRLLYRRKDILRNVDPLRDDAGPVAVVAAPEIDEQ